MLFEGENVWRVEINRITSILECWDWIRYRFATSFLFYFFQFSPLLIVNHPFPLFIYDQYKSGHASHPKRFPSHRHIAWLPFCSALPKKWNNSTFKPFKDEDLIETFSLSKNKSYIITEGDLQTAAEESVLVGRNSMGPLCIRRTDGSSDKSMYIVYRPIYPAVYIMGPHIKWVWVFLDGQLAVLPSHVEKVCFSLSRI